MECLSGLVCPLLAAAACGAGRWYFVATVGLTTLCVLLGWTFCQSIAYERAQRPVNKANLAIDLNNLANLHHTQGKLEEAEAGYREVSDVAWRVQCGA